MKASTRFLSSSVTSRWITSASSRTLLPQRRAPSRNLTAMRRSHSTQSNTPSQHQNSTDPHVMANEMVRENAQNLRLQGTEALEAVPFQTKLQNYGMAAGLVSFCTWVWWYSIMAVGKADGGTTFEEEAMEARSKQQQQKSLSQQEAEELARLDIGGVSGDEQVTLAVAAPDEIATAEEQSRRAVGANKESGRPLWKKIVLFWKN